MRTPTVVFYISSHGLGHASRQIEVINALSDAATVRITVRTMAPNWLFERTLRRPATVDPVSTDTGVVQFDSLRLDVDGTIQAAARFYADIERRADTEAAWLSAHGASLVVTDAPPLACEAAARASVPCIVVANFTWDWIYAAYADQLRGAPWLVSCLERAYARATAAWRLPMSGGFSSIADVIDVPFVARHARHEPAAVRRALDLPPDRPLVLASFGGHGVDRSDPVTVDAGECAVVTTAADRAGLPIRPMDGSGFCVDEDRLYDLGYRYEDLVAAVDVVVTKPGYGIIAECVANDTAILYTSRGHFIEYERLVSDMPHYVACEYIPQADLFAGRWAPALDRLRARRPPDQKPRTDGAAIIADRILAHLEPHTITQEAR